MDTDRIYMEELKKELPYRDRRTLKRWCQNNQVRVLCDEGSNRLYVLRYEFESGKERNHKTRHGRNHKKCKQEILDYIPKGEYEKGFLSIFTSLL